MVIMNTAVGCLLLCTVAQCWDWNVQCERQADRRHLPNSDVYRIGMPMRCRLFAVVLCCRQKLHYCILALSRRTILTEPLGPSLLLLLRVHWT